MGGRPWSPEDIEILGSLAGDIPWPLVPGRFNSARPRRTEAALRRKADDLGLLRNCTGQYLTSGALQAIAGFNAERVRRWILRGQIPARRFGQGQSYAWWIRRSDLRAFAQANPEVFAGLSEGQLVELLDSEPLAAQLAALALPRPRQCVVVECVETGVRYRSIRAAAKAAYVTPQRMAAVLAHGTTANGRHYRRVEIL